MTVRNLKLPSIIDTGSLRIISLVILIFSFGCSAIRSERGVNADSSLHVDPTSINLGQGQVNTTSVVALHLEGDSTVLGSIPNQLEIEPGEHIIVPVVQAGSVTSENARARIVKLAIRISPDLSPGDWDASIRFAPDNASTDGVTVNLRGTVSGP
jgi:hypothetical protein